MEVGRLEIVAII